MKNSFRRICSKFLPEKSAHLRTYLLIVLLLVSGTTILWEAMYEVATTRLMQCYAADGNLLPRLSDIEVPPDSIFFHETSCQLQRSRDIKLDARQACAVESAARHHPENVVFLLLAAPVFIELNSTQNPAVRALLQYPNIKIRHINVHDYIGNTGLGETFSVGLRRSRYPVSHTSDVLRYATLLKYRGTYMDLDVIVIDYLLNIHNFVGAESPRSLGAGVINFGPDATGQEMAEECAQELQRTFDGAQWGNNGPGVITRVLHRKCNTTTVQQLLSCPHFRVLPSTVFYAFPFWESKMFFQPGKLQHAQKILNNSLVIHLWNRVSGRFRPAVGGDVPLTFYAQRHCPRVFAQAHGKL